MATCLHPTSVRGVLYPCGKCPVCRQNMRQSKGDRFVLAAAFNRKFGGSNFFLTLTYSDDNINFALPPNTHDGEYIACFSKNDIEAFIRAVRRRHECKYFVASEYGTQTHRPHYHLILLFRDNLRLIDCQNLVDACWSKGFNTVATLNDNRVQYAAKYVLKDDPYFLQYKVAPVKEVSVYGKNRFEQYHSDDLRKPFTLISNHFLRDEAIDWLNEYIYNGGNIRECLQISGQNVTFDAYIKSHIDPSLLMELRAAYNERKAEVQETLSQSRVNNSKFIEINGVTSVIPDYTKDMEIYKHRLRLKMLKKLSV